MCIIAVSELDCKLVILYCRVSSPGQRENLQDQIADTSKTLCDLGFSIHNKPYSEIETGRTFYRSVFADARIEAYTTGLPIVAFSLLRFIRPHKHGQPIPSLDFMREEKITYATILHPDLPENEIRGIETKRGMYAKKRMGGRTTAIDLATQKHIRLFWICGEAIRSIADRLNIPRSVVGRIIKSL